MEDLETEAQRLNFSHHFALPCIAVLKEILKLIWSLRTDVVGRY